MLKKLLFVSFIILTYLMNIYAQDYHGVFVGISAYPPPGQLPDDCIWDAQDMRGKLIQYYGWQTNNTDLLLDGYATEQNIKNKINAMPRTSINNDLFYFSGHGSLDDFGLVCVDLQILSPSELQTAFGSFNNYSCFLDACHSGIFPHNMSKGVISSACDDDEHAYCGGPNGHSVFTAFLCQGLQYLKKSAEDLHNYAAPLTTAYKSDMHPQLGDFVSGNIGIGYTLSGTMTKSEVWYYPVTLNGNLSIQSYSTLTLKTGISINLVNGSNKYYIKSAGGTIYKQ